MEGQVGFVFSIPFDDGELDGDGEKDGHSLRNDAVSREAIVGDLQAVPYKRNHYCVVVGPKLIREGPCGTSRNDEEPGNKNGYERGDVQFPTLVGHAICWQANVDCHDPFDGVVGYRTT